MSHSNKVRLGSFLVFPRQVETWSENRHDKRNRFGFVGTWIFDLALPEPLVFQTHRFQLEEH